MSGHRFELMGESALVARDGDVYIAGQPTEADLDAWAARGVKLVVNLRSRAEKAELPYLAPAALESRGMVYLEIPMGGADGIGPHVREQLTEALAGRTPGPVVLHCRTGPRAACAYAAHLLAEGQLGPEGAAGLGWPGGLPPEALGMLGAT